MRTILLVSLVLNVALAVALVTWVSSTRNTAPRVVRPISTATVNSNLVRIIKTNVLVRPRAFTWHEVESQDYAVYVENLRALGMPETTIRDVIVADVDQLFAQRRGEEALQQDIEWWRSSPSAEFQSNTLARAQAIDGERNALLTRLLGAGWDAGLPEHEKTPLALVGPVLGNLSDEVKASVREIAARSSDRVREYISRKQSAGENLNPADLARLREETRQQLSAILNPQQLEEFLLRYSDNAGQLRQELTGFNATPDEFRSIFRAVDSIDREIQSRFSGDAAASVRSRQAMEQQRLAAIRNAVGPQRFQAYQTLHDPAYRDALAVAQQVGGGEEVAQALYTINRATAEELNRIRNDSTLSALQRQQLIRAMEAEQQRARSLVLGETPAEETAVTTPTVTPPVPDEPPVRGHAVIPGDTLGNLAVQYGVPISVIRAANPGLDINHARPGTVIVIPERPSVMVVPLPPPPPPLRLRP